MKIKLSKSKWEEVGKKAGWLKLSKTSETNELKITPVIKKTRITKSEYDVCPHCEREIMEKETYVDPENYVYHSSCKEKGPIDKIKPLTEGELEKIFPTFKMAKNNKKLKNILKVNSEDTIEHGIRE